MFSFHTHTKFCDGKSTVDEFCEKAIDLKMVSIAFTSHAPVPFENSFSLSFNQLFDYKKTIIEAQEKYKSKLSVYIGLEADYIPGITVSFNEWRRLLNLDFIVGSVHLVKNNNNGDLWFIDGPSENYHVGLKNVFNDDIKCAVKAYYSQIREMVINEKPDIVGHFDKVKMNNYDKYFGTNEHWYQDEIDQTLSVFKEFNTIVEINSRGIYKGRLDSTFPGIVEIEKCLRHNIDLTLASDSHHIDDLQMGYDLALKYAKGCGVNNIVAFNGNNWEKLLI
ncbi:MAG: histidinol-phosphatase [Bacteroidales bacterium]|nr:histidinol-phosphatase [Bacteroidales bacterium]